MGWIGLFELVLIQHWDGTFDEIFVWAMRADLSLR